VVRAVRTGRKAWTTKPGSNPTTNDYKPRSQGRGFFVLTRIADGDRPPVRPTPVQEQRRQADMSGLISRRANPQVGDYTLLWPTIFDSWPAVFSATRRPDAGTGEAVVRSASILASRVARQALLVVARSEGHARRGVCPLATLCPDWTPMVNALVPVSWSQVTGSIPCCPSRAPENQNKDNTARGGRPTGASRVRAQEAR
jgi:hypothetical protein